MHSYTVILLQNKTESLVSTLETTQVSVLKNCLTLRYVIKSFIHQRTFILQQFQIFLFQKMTKPLQYFTPFKWSKSQVCFFCPLIIFSSPLIIFYYKYYFTVFRLMLTADPIQHYYVNITSYFLF